ncbi:MAG: hypothetical protein K6E91_03725 [Butyrivibrio sp.]|nr:hypothetical protein [Butyrivibrio sp.]
MKIKYVNYEFPTADKENMSWNIMTFYGCRVISMNTVEYKAGRRMSIEIEAPKFRKKYYLYAWSDAGVLNAIEKAGLQVGDYISCHTELSYYKNSEGRHCEAYKIVANDAYDSKVPENERFFKFMIIKRDSVSNNRNQKKTYMSKNELLRKMIG